MRAGGWRHQNKTSLCTPLNIVLLFTISKIYNYKIFHSIAEEFFTDQPLFVFE
jgi:hypothetical protein